MKYGLLAASACALGILAGCSDNTDNTQNNAAGQAAPVTNAVANTANAATPPAPAAAAPAAEEDVTKAGFPFKPGVYSNATCDPNSGGLVEFMKEGLHYWEADQATDFAKIIKTGDGIYRITEVFQGDDGPGDPEDADYVRVDAKSFKRTTHWTWDDKGNHIKQDGTETYKYCKPLETY